MLSEELIRQTLASANIRGISGIIIRNQKAFITIEVNSNNTSEIENAVQKALTGHIDKDDIKLIFTNQHTSSDSRKKYYIEGVKKVILVSSGKGGVGKSTMAVMLADRYCKEGHKVGLIDADIYGPSIPTMFGINEKPKIVNQKFVPIEARRVKLMSVGFLVDNDAPIAWRGPMASKMLYKMLSTTDWGLIDYLIIDMPPGTGDIHLSILENYHIDGVVIVTTPQQISMGDVDRAMALYTKFQVTILSIIENMSDIFPGNAGEILAHKYDIQKIEKIKFNRAIAEAADSGDLSYQI
jgi:ATP-binding protein involved in chromosome partitioning